MNRNIRIINVQGTYMVKANTDNEFLLHEVKIELENHSGIELHAFLKAEVSANKTVLGAKENPVGAADMYTCVQTIEIPQAGGGITAFVPDTNRMLAPGNTAVLKLELYENADCSGQPLTVYINGNWQRTRHWEFYLSQSMHTDIGYTNYQEELPALYTSYLETAKRFIRESDERDTDLQKYLYAIESGWVMGEGYMTQSNAEAIDEIRGLIEKGRMEIGAGQFNYTMECFSTEELARAAYYTNRYLVDKLGIAPGVTERMFDNPAFSKSYVDVASSAGIRYGYHSMNGDRSPYWKKKEYDLFYLNGNIPGNKLLIFNGHMYADNYGFSGSDIESCKKAVLQNIDKLIEELCSLRDRRSFPYDKFPMQLIPFGDNQRPDDMQIQVANAVNQEWSEKGYVFPKIKTAFPKEFFSDVEKEYGFLIPSEDGTEENWWNDGWGTTAYESGINKLAGNLIPAAETLSSFAAFSAGKCYPYNALSNAMYRNLVYDEHTWGFHAYDNSPMYHAQWEWKRSNAFGAKALADQCIRESVQALAEKAVHASKDAKSIYVYNGLNWSRDDVVRIVLPEDFPAAFKLMDKKTSVPYAVTDHVLCFVAKGVPAMGYKVFEVVRADTESAAVSEEINGSVIENEYYKVIFDSDGTIASITDKTFNREIVDQNAKEKFNQYRYYDDHGVPFSNMGFPFDEDKWTLHTPVNASLSIIRNDVCETARVCTSAFRNPKITQTVTLYHGLPRIDIVNEVVKGALPSLTSIEEAFYTFPFRTEGKHEIRYDLPLGNIAEGEQVYGTSHDWYTVSKWTAVRDVENGYNMVLASPNTALMQFGERRTGNWSFDYISEKPYLYSYVFNNMWQTNFQGDQPGYADFRYSLSTNNGGSDMTENNRLGWETVHPLQAALTDGAVPLNNTGSYLTVGSDHVQLTTMKPAEANGEGMILRFAEICGKDTADVTVILPAFAEIVETDIIENDLAETARSGASFRFDIPAYGFKTFRIRYRADSPAKPSEVSAVVSSFNGYEENLVTVSDIRASSAYGYGYAPENVKNIYGGGEWASKAECDPWIIFTWKEPVTIGVFYLASRFNGADLVEKAEIYADGGVEPVAVFTGNPLRNDGAADKLVLDQPITVRELKIQLIGSKYGAKEKNNGLRSFAAYKEEDKNEQLCGTYITWKPVENAHFYQIFRSTDKDFKPGSGSFLGATNCTGYYDSQVFSNMAHTYWYTVRAVGASGNAGEFSEKVTSTSAEITGDLSSKEKPELHAMVRDENRIDLWWTPAVNQALPISHYEIERDGVRLSLLRKNDYVVCYRDCGVKTEPGKAFVYTVIAVDTFGNETSSDPVTVTIS